MTNRVELLSPAGDFETALAAFDAGADAVYCGLQTFSARAFAKNLSIDDLKSLMRVARARGKKVYVAFNTLVKEDGFETALRQLSLLAEISPDALIVQDLGIARIVRKYFPSLKLHASTQLATHNLAGVTALAELGFVRIVPARELSAEEVSFLAKRSGNMEFECFIHGALCYSVSGLCLFSAMEKQRSGNCGQCAYCCRLPYDDPRGGRSYPFSMKDLRIGDDVAKLLNAGVTSLKIEGRMKSALYVASVTRWYRQILDRILGNAESQWQKVTIGDLETVFSRRTTELYLDGRKAAQSPIDAKSLGHLGAFVGTAKRLTKDREGRVWLRFHTLRTIEKHDGLQFESDEGGKPLGFGITLMRQAISRVPVFEVAAGSDVEVLFPFEDIKPGTKIYCSMSNAVKRMFPAPSFRPSDYEGDVAIDVTLKIDGESVRATAIANDLSAKVEFVQSGSKAQHPERTLECARKAFAKLGGTDYRLNGITLEDPNGIFVPVSVMNDLRRGLVEKLDEVRQTAEKAMLEKALADDALPGSCALHSETGTPSARRTVRLRPDQKLPAGEWDEIVWLVDAGVDVAALEEKVHDKKTARIALPVFTPEADFQRLRIAAKRLVRLGFAAWEAADLATLHLLRELGVTDISADWTLYAFNASALKCLADLGIRRFVASPENDAHNLAFLSECGCDVEFLEQQSTPLFISLTKPAFIPDAKSGIVAYERNGLWITTRRTPRTFKTPADASYRVDLSWDAL